MKSRSTGEGTSDMDAVDLDFYDSVSDDSATVCARSGTDRRQAVLRTALSSLIRRRRRGERRRAAQPAVPYVDVHEPVLLLVSLGIVVLSVMDAYLTLALLERGAEEANPLMALLLQRGVNEFFVVKFVLTAIGVVALVMHKHFRILRVLDGYRLLGGVLLLYAALIYYELAMLLP